MKNDGTDSAISHFRWGFLYNLCGGNDCRKVARSPQVGASSVKIGCQARRTAPAMRYSGGQRPQGMPTPANLNEPP